MLFLMSIMLNRVFPNWYLYHTLLKEKKLDKKDVDAYIKTMLVHSKKISKAVKEGKLDLHRPRSYILLERKLWSRHCVWSTSKFGYKNIRLYPMV